MHRRKNERKSEWERWKEKEEKQSYLFSVWSVLVVGQKYVNWIHLRTSHPYVCICMLSRFQLQLQFYSLHVSLSLSLCLSSYLYVECINESISYVHKWDIVVISTHLTFPLIPGNRGTHYITLQNVSSVFSVFYRLWLWLWLESTQLNSTQLKTRVATTTRKTKWFNLIRLLCS